jgi:NADP-dependent 3-hydroxy acid dehydrogenase YdfG
MDNDVKVYITGTKRGLGSVFESKFLEKGWTICSLNRPEYDLNKNLDDFVTTDFDLYINNAHSGFTQTELLYKLFEANENRKCTILNISSMSPERQLNYIRKDQAEKASLDKAARQLQFLEKPCRILLLKPGRFDFSQQPVSLQKISNEYMANLVFWLINQPHNINFDISVKYNNFI